MNHDKKAMFILLDALEEANMRIAEATAQVRLLVTGHPQEFETPNTPPTPHTVHPPAPERDFTTHPIPDGAFPNYYAMHNMTVPESQDAALGIGYDQAGRTILSSEHTPIEWVESDFEVLVERIQPNIPTKIVVFGKCFGTLSDGTIGTLLGRDSHRPIIFTGFDRDSVIEDLLIDDAIGNVFFENLTIRNMTSRRALRVGFENCLFDGTIGLGHGPKDCQENQFRFCGTTHDCHIGLRNPASYLFEWCTFARQNQIELYGFKGRHCVAHHNFGQPQEALEQS